MSDPLRPGDIHDDKDEKKKWILFLSLTFLDREAMDENVVPAVASHFLNLSVHLKNLMSLITVLKLATLLIIINIILIISSISASISNT